MLVYRSAILGGDTAPATALAAALWERGLAPTIVAVASLKDPEAVAAVREAIAVQRPAVIVATTAFSARDDAGFVLDAADCPVIQAFTVGSSREAWAASSRGLGAADLAMQVALPEFDGRLSGFPVSHKEEAPEVEGFRERRAVPDFAGIAATADRAAAWARLAATPRAERRLALVLSDYPARGGRAGFAVGLDTPASTRAILELLAAEGYAVSDIPEPAVLMRRLTEEPRASRCRSAPTRPGMPGCRRRPARRFSPSGASLPTIRPSWTAPSGSGRSKRAGCAWRSSRIAATRATARRAITIPTRCRATPLSPSTSPCARAAMR